MNRSCRRIHFLHAAVDSTPYTSEVACVYRLVSDNGIEERAEIRSPKEVLPYRTTRQFWARGGRVTYPSANLAGEIAWVGVNADVASRDETLLLTHTTWQLPDRLHGEKVDTLEIRAASDEVTPLVFAITVE